MLQNLEQRTLCVLVVSPKVMCLPERLNNLELLTRLRCISAKLKVHIQVDALRIHKISTCKLRKPETYERAIYRPLKA